MLEWLNLFTFGSVSMFENSLFTTVTVNEDQNQIRGYHYSISNACRHRAQEIRKCGICQVCLFVRFDLQKTSEAVKQLFLGKKELSTINNNIIFL